MWVREEPKTGKVRYCESFKDYYTGKKRVVSITFDKDTAKNRKEAARLLQEKISAKMEPEDKRYTLEKLIEMYHDDLKITAKQSTMRRNKFALEAVKKILGPDTLAERITPLYTKKMFASSQKRNSALNGYLKRLKMLLKWALKNQLIQSMNGVENMDPFHDRSHKEKISDKYMESDELKRVIESMEEPMWSLLTEFLALSGLRVGELIALEKRDIDMDTGVIHVSKTYDSNNKVVNTAKTVSSADDVVIQPELASVIRKINTLMLSRSMRYRFRTKLFVSNNSGTYMHYYTYNKYLKENTERILGKKLTPHSLRHTHASLLFEAGFSLDEVSRRLRHGDSKITKEIYIHVTQKLREKDAEKIRKLQLL